MPKAHSGSATSHGVTRFFKGWWLSDILKTSFKSGFFFTGCCGSNRLFTNLNVVKLISASISTLRGASQRFAWFMIARRARRVGETGKTYDWGTRFSGPVESTDCTVALFGLRLRRGDLGAVDKRVVPFILRLR